VYTPSEAWPEGPAERTQGFTPFKHQYFTRQIIKNQKIYTQPMNISPIE
jgi:hypothetical protein